MDCSSFRLRTLILVTSLSLLSPCVCGARPLKLDRIVATVNQDVITEYELDTESKLIYFRFKEARAELPPESQMRPRILDKLISDKLQLQKAQEQGLELEEAMVEQALANYSQSRELSEADLLMNYASAGISEAQLRASLKKDLLLSQLQHREIDPQLVISNAEIDQALRSPSLQDESGAEFHLKHILIAVPSNSRPELVKQKKALSERIAAQLRAGASFAKMAATYSDDGLSMSGGDLGWRRLAEIPSIFIKYVPSMTAAEIMGPISSASGFHIIELVDKRSKELVRQEELHLRQILVKTGSRRSDREALNLLNTYRAQINQGARLETLAARYSEEASSSYKGGDLGWLTPSQLLPEFYQAVKGLPLKQISEPFKTALGWHLVEVEARRNTQTSSEALRNKARDLLYRRKFEEALQNWLNNLKDSANIDYPT